MKTMRSNQQISQVQFAQLIGVTPPRVTQLLNDGVIAKGQSGLEWIRAYCQRLRDTAAERMGADGEEGGALDLVQERAALAREQRIGHEIKNASLRGEYAPRPVLEKVLAMASDAIAQRIAALDAQVAAAAPGLPADAAETVRRVVASAAAEWARSTQPHLLTAASTEEITDPEADTLEE